MVVYRINNCAQTKKFIHVSFEVLTAVVMKEVSDFWDIRKILQFAESQNVACYLLHAGFFRGIFFELEDGWDVGCLSTDYTASYPRTQNSSSLYVIPDTVS
jgi:hypothetical protein